MTGQAFRRTSRSASSTVFTAHPAPALTVHLVLASACPLRARSWSFTVGDCGWRVHRATAAHSRLRCPSTEPYPMGLDQTTPRGVVGKVSPADTGGQETAMRTILIAPRDIAYSNQLA